MPYRTEKDFLGEKQVPEEAYWGIHTQRALENFPLSGYRLNPSLVKALAMVKKACARANLELGYLEEKQGRAILAACDEVIEGRLRDQFPLDALQGGAGTSSNMNVNEVLANRAAELLGGKKGDYAAVHPIEHVNLHQSTNDVYPTALKAAAILLLRDLSPAIARLQGAFQRKEKEFAKIVKVGRTELQEAVPITLGGEFSAFGEAMARDRWRTFKCEERLRVVNLGGTAVGTGLSAPRSYIFLAVEKLREITGLGLSRGEDLLDATANTDPFVEVSGILQAHAASLVKIANDLRLLHLLGEIELPKLQAGSSIMPGKVNPVLLEAAVQVGLKVMANDSLVSGACSRSTLQINEFLPLLAHALLESMDILTRMDGLLADHVEGITANEGKCREIFDSSPMIVTAFLPRIGYERAGALLAEFLASGRKNVREFLREKLGADLVETVLSAEKLMSLGYREDEITPFTIPSPPLGGRGPG
jgi:aspartate ammonia-lyase